MSISKRSRIFDVAEKAGVSMMTVSRVLNQDEKVSEKTREKVLKIVKELNYRPNVSARRLASSKSFFLGLLYNNPSTSYVTQFLLGALKSCRSIGYHLIVDEADLDINKTIAQVKDLIEITEVDGMILLPPVCDMPEVISILREANVPFVRIAPDKQLEVSPYICLDDYQAAFEVTENLIKQGHTKIGHILGNPDQGVSRLRYEGYLAALKKHHISVAPEHVAQGYFSYKSGLEAANKILSVDNKPTAIFASNDDMAAAAIATAQMKNINIPEQLAVVGFDDTSLATTVWPAISTVRQPLQDMADLAINILNSGKFKNLAEVNTDNFRHVLNFELIERESSLLTRKA